MSAAPVPATPEGWLFLSPHLDDAVLSCGGRIAQAARSGAEVEILTLFAGDEPGPDRPPVSPLVETIYALWKLPPGSVMTTRRGEDLAACRLLGARAEHWELQEAIHRRDPDSGAALYPSLERLFGGIAQVEEPVVAALAERLSALAGGDPARRVAAPLGVGGHVDHRITRVAAERAFGERLVYYEEFPYVVWKLFALRRAGISPRRYSAESIPLADTDIAARIAAIACYASQVPSLFRTSQNLERQVRKHVRRARGERLWRRRRAGGAVGESRGGAR